VALTGARLALSDSLIGLMETAAPSVVAVVVTRDPGPWLEDTLRALGAQDYSELSILVLDANSTEDPTARVGEVLPNAYVRRLGTNDGFAASANAVLGMVEGASYYLVCHDDVAPDPDAVHLLVEESFRSNAAIVAPKVVDFEDPSRLLHVGLAVDKGGAVVDRVEPGEIDHGQHDAVQDVFAVPGGCTLVRADLFSELGGFDRAVVAMGEDLDLCWRAQVAGARVVVAPAAVVRHQERMASGRRELDGFAPDIGHHRRARRHQSSGHDRFHRRDRSDHDKSNRTDLLALQRRHELRAVLKCYGPFHLARVIPQLVILSTAEFTLALLTGHRARASVVAHSWKWNVSKRKELRIERAELKKHRRFADSEVRRLQLHGSARLSGFLRRAFTYDMNAAHLGRAHDAALGGLEDAGAMMALSTAPSGAHRVGLSGAQGGAPRPSHPEAQAHAGSRPSDADGSRREELPVLGERRFSATVQTALWSATVIILIFGSRQLLGAGFPVIGQLLPFPSSGEMLHRFLSGWQPTGLGLTGPATPGLGILGVVGTILVGAVGLLQKIVVLGCVPLGAWGMSRLVAPFGSKRARLVSALAYLALPLPYNAIAAGRWDGLIAYAFAPWVLRALATAAGAEPYSNREERSGVHGPLRRSQLLRKTLALGVAEATAAAFAPSSVLLVLVLGAGLGFGFIVVGGADRWNQAKRVCLVAGGSTAVTAVLLWPWTFSLLGGPGRWVALTGPAELPSSAPSWGHLLRFAVGPIGDTVLAFGFLLAAALPLLIGGRWRLAWAGRAWVLALVAWVLVWLGGRGWTGPIAMPAQILLAPAGAALAFAIGLGVVAFESDLPAYRFGWRQGASLVAAAAALVATVPVLVASTNGRWSMPATGYGDTTSWMGPAPSASGYHVLWLGNASVLPGGGWQIEPGLSYELTSGSLPDVTDLWPGASEGAASAVVHDIELARNGDTIHLGSLLAPYSVSYIAVVSNLGPVIPGEQSPPSSPPPSDLNYALGRQIDLRQMLSEGGVDVYGNGAALPQRAVLESGAAASSTGAIASGDTAVRQGQLPLEGWKPVLPGSSGANSYSGRVPAGTLFAGVAPAPDWQLSSSQNGSGEYKFKSGTAFGYAPTFALNQPADVTLKFRGSWTHGLAVGIECLLWVLLFGFLWGWWRRAARRLGWRGHRRVKADVVEEVTKTSGPAQNGGGGGDSSTATKPVTVSVGDGS